MDFMILNWIQTHMRCDFLDFIFSHITMLGNGGLIWIFICVLLLFTKRYRKAGIFILLAMLTGLSNLSLHDQDLLYSSPLI